VKFRIPAKGLFRKTVFIGLPLMLAACFGVSQFLSRRVASRVLRPVGTNEHNVIFELPHSERTIGRLQRFVVSRSVADTPYYLISNRLILATNADVLLDPVSNGVRRMRVLKPESAEWSFRVERTITRRILFLKSSNPPKVVQASWGVGREIWTSEPLRNSRGELSAAEKK
jgi:hypothetical protein